LQDVELLDTSGWLTYRNEEWGFEMRYPENYSFYDTGVKIDQTQELETLVIIESPYGGQQSPYLQLVIQVKKDPPFKRIEEYGEPLVNLTNVRAAKENPYERAGAYTVVHNGLLYYISVSSKGQKLNSYLESILESLQFTPDDMSSSILEDIIPHDLGTLSPSTSELIDMSDWVLYRNEERRFELKYPKEWQLTYDQRTSPAAKEHPENVIRLIRKSDKDSIIITRNDLALNVDVLPIETFDKTYADILHVNDRKVYVQNGYIIHLDYKAIKYTVPQKTSAYQLFFYPISSPYKEDIPAILSTFTIIE
jgi:hypothetical protein